MKVVNAEGKVLGRLASSIARSVKDGEEVRVVNSEKAVISGDEADVKDEYKTRFDRGRRDRGPYYPKRPDKILKRTVRGMLPDHEKRGREMHSRVKTYLGVPTEFDEVEEVDVKEGDELQNRNYVKLGEVSKHIGWTPRGDQN
ncbi:MAG: 50S ribosomal protein L13 [Nanohaloarchaea archaeon SW_7_46_7]|nr:MAG: 50S ribosomal protein L13 [Nanohaloarchaea archaeon SW_7_46_7]